MLSVIIKEIKEYFRSPIAVFMTALFPMLLVFILGTMLQNLDTSDAAIGEITLQYSVSEEGIQSAAFESFINEIDMIKAEKTTDKQKALALADKEKINAFIEINGSEITLYSGTNRVINNALLSVLHTFSQTTDTIMKIAEVNPAELGEIITDASKEQESYVERKGLGISRSMIDYYAVCIIVMMIFMSGITGNSENIRDEQKQNTLARITVSTTPRFSIFIGKVIGSMPVSVISVVFTMLCSVVLFDAKYCSDFAGNAMLALMLFSVAIAASSFGMLLGIVMKIPAAYAIMPICWSMLFLSGSFSKEIFAEGLSEYMPPYIIQQAAFKLTLFGEYTSAVIITLICLAVFAVLTVLSAVAFTKKKAI